MKTFADSCAVALQMPDAAASIASTQGCRPAPAISNWSTTMPPRAASSPRRGPIRSMPRPIRDDTTALAAKNTARISPPVASP